MRHEPADPLEPEPAHHARIRQLAYDRGTRGSSFATAYELTVPGYDAAWQQGREAARTQAQAPRFAVLGYGDDGLLIDTEANDTPARPVLLACLPYDEAQAYAQALNQGQARIAADLDRAARLAGVLAQAMVKVTR